MGVFIGAVKGASAIAKKVAEVNELIKIAQKYDGYVIDPSSTWETMYKLNPYKYSRGVLFESYSENGGQGWKKKSNRYSSKDAMIALNFAARMLRTAIRKEEKQLDSNRKDRLYY